MANCALCHVASNKLYQSRSKNKVSWICTACNSRLNNGRQLNRTKIFSRLTLFAQLAYVFGHLVTNKGRKVLKGLLKK
jgi:hypothetical protein